MPAFYAPRRSGPHRIAAIALYRALLLKCRVASVSIGQREAFRNVVKSKFRRNVHVVSKRLLTDAFKAGHEALDHLHFSAHGNVDSTSYLLSILSRVPPWMKQPPKPPPDPVHPKPKPPLASGFENSALAVRPLPFSALKGRKRVVPTLISANRIPVLRYQTPQPAALSRYIKARILHNQKLHDRKWQLTEALPLADWEDTWDRHIERSLARDANIKHADARRSSMHEPAWKDQIDMALSDNCEAMNRETQKNKLWADKIVDIIDRETELAEQERKDRQMAKNKMRRERKKAREEADEGKKLAEL